MKCMHKIPQQYIWKQKKGEKRQFLKLVMAGVFEMCVFDYKILETCKLCIIFSSNLVPITAREWIEYLSSLFYILHHPHQRISKTQLHFTLTSHKTSLKKQKQNAKHRRSLESWVSSELVNWFKRWRAIYQFISYMLQWLLSIFFWRRFFPLPFPTYNSFYRSLRASAFQRLTRNGMKRIQMNKKTSTLI